MKISSLLIAFVLIGLFASVFALYYASIGTTYGVQYDSSSLTVYNQMSTITNQTNEIQAQMENATLSNNLFYVFGGVLKQGVTMTKTTFQSVRLFTAMGDVAFAQIPGAGLFKSPLITIAVILFTFIIVGIFLSRVEI